MTKWTEDRVERAVERKFDALDARLMSGKIEQAAYDTEAREITKWADEKYAGR